MNAGFTDAATSVLFAVQSAPGNTDRRDFIRDTWCGECAVLANCHCVFVVGLSAENDEDVKDEAVERGDLLQLDMVDSYNNLTLKTLHSIR